ncbi:MAG: hypothetical protein H0X45_07135 [Planctomycetes bacterium]|nr:hypothetical protein [Planctomycetota bacterium]
MAIDALDRGAIDTGDGQLDLVAQARASAHHRRGASTGASGTGASGVGASDVGVSGAGPSPAGASRVASPFAWRFPALAFAGFAGFTGFTGLPHSASGRIGGGACTPSFHAGESSTRTHNLQHGKLAQSAI